MSTPIREARLRPEFAELYPAITPGTWMAASAIGQQLLLWHLAAGRPPDGERLLSEAHFEFRGGSRRNGEWSDERRRDASSGL